MDGDDDANDDDNNNSKEETTKNNNNNKQTINQNTFLVVSKYEKKLYIHLVKQNKKKDVF